MKILSAIVIPPHLTVSGAVNAAIALSHALQPHCDVEVAMMADETTDETVSGLRVRKRHATNPLGFTRGLLPNKFRTLLYRSDIATLVQDYDLVHLHNPIPALELLAIAKACQRAAKPYVITTHGFVEVFGMQAGYKLGRLESLAGRFLIHDPVVKVLSHAAKICCLSPQDRELLSERGIADQRLTVIPNGVDPAYFTEPSAEEMKQVCVRFGLPLEKADGVPVCFFLANHTRNKGLDILLEAFLRSATPYRLIVGGKKRDDYDYEGYTKRAQSHQRILFTDRLSDQEIRCLHHYSDLFVFPSRADTLPLVILDAMAAGRAILSTRVGGIPYQVEPDCGCLVEPENPEALREAFERMVGDREQLIAQGNAARIRVRDHFNWKRSAELTANVYREVLQKSPG
jgi:starch synthase